MTIFSIPNIFYWFSLLFIINLWLILFIYCLSLISPFIFIITFLSFLWPNSAGLVHTTQLSLWWVIQCPPVFSASFSLQSPAEFFYFSWPLQVRQDHLTSSDQWHMSLLMETFKTLCMERMFPSINTAWSFRQSHGGEMNLDSYHTIGKKQLQIDCRYKWEQ